MTENEKLFVESIVNLNSDVYKVQEYIKENYNIDSEYSEEDLTLHIIANNVNESLNAALAKDYVNKTIDENLLTVVFNY